MEVTDASPDYKSTTELGWLGSLVRMTGDTVTTVEL